jgi:D-sedoheptulose 7-phosphate isomerase
VNLKEKIDSHCNVINLLNYEKAEIDKIINNITKKIKKGGKILFCGNGGSAADAQHLAAEFIIRLRPSHNRKPLPALSLSMDSSTMSACLNDFSKNDIFLRPFLALSNKNDILFAISTSGKSKNIIKVLKEAKHKKIYSVSLLGKNGGDARNYTENKIIVKSNNVALIQEAHIFLGHYILEKVEDKLLR